MIVRIFVISMKSTKKYFSLLFLLPFVFFFSCRKENMFDMVKGTGKRITEFRELPPFTKIYLKDNVNVILSPGSQHVKVEAGEKLIPLIKTKVKDSVLYIEDNNKCNWARSYKKGVISVYISVPTLRYIWHYGSGNITCTDTIPCDVLDIETRETGDVELLVKAGMILAHLHGTSDVTLRGRSTYMGSFHIGEGYFYGSDLITYETWFYSKASGNDYFNVTSGVSGRIAWAGDVYLYGKPSYISVVREGKGKLIRMN